MCSLWVYVQYKLAVHTVSTNQRKQATVAVCMDLTMLYVKMKNQSQVLLHERNILIMLCIVNWFTILMFTVCI